MLFIPLLKIIIILKQKLLVILFLGFALFGFSQYTAIPDANFEQALIDLGYDTTIDGQVLTANISSLTSLDVESKNIADLTGIEDFTALTFLRCNNNQLTSIDVSNNTALTILYCHINQLTSLDVTVNTALTELVCRDNLLTSLDVTTNTALTYLNCMTNQLTSLNVSNNTALDHLQCTTNQLTSLDVSSNTALTILSCSSNQLTSLDVSTNTALTSLNCHSNQFSNLDVSANTALIVFDCTNNTQLTSLDVSSNTALAYLYCHTNLLTSLDVRNGNNTGFFHFEAQNNPNLTCILVDDAAYSTTNWTNVDTASTFVNNETECTALLSVEDNTFELGVSIYPNPTDRYLFIEGNENPLSISIYNLLGKKVLSAKDTKEVDVKGLSNGVYMIKITDGLIQAHKKFVKN